MESFMSTVHVRHTVDILFNPNFHLGIVLFGTFGMQTTKRLHLKQTVMPEVQYICELQS